MWRGDFFEGGGERRDEGMDRGLIVDMERCNGCRICELVCSSSHFEEYNPALSYIRVLVEPRVGVHYPALKMGCDLCGGGYRCAEWCPREALRFVEPSEAAAAMKDRIIGSIPAPMI